MLIIGRSLSLLVVSRRKELPELVSIWQSTQSRLWPCRACTEHRSDLEQYQISTWVFRSRSNRHHGSRKDKGTLPLFNLAPLVSANIYHLQTVKKSAKVLVERYYPRLTLDFEVNKRTCDEVAIIASKRLRIKVCIHKRPPLPKNPSSRRTSNR